MHYYHKKWIGFKKSASFEKEKATQQQLKCGPRGKEMTKREKKRSERTIGRKKKKERKKCAGKSSSE